MAKKKSTAVTTPTETDDQLLARSIGLSSLALRRLKEKSPAGDELIVTVCEQWRKPHNAGPRDYAVKSYDPGFGAAVWFDKKRADGDPSLSNAAKTLIPAVRRALDIPASGAAPAEDDKKPTGKTDHPSKTLAADPLASVEVIEEGEFPYSFFKRTKLNPRTSFDDEMIDAMAPNIESICRLSPILMMVDGTIIDGETRHRAAEKAGAKKLYGKKLKCTEEQAAIIRLQTTVKRRDLNPIDRATAMQSLATTHGLSPGDIAKVVGMKKADSVRNIIRLLELPEEWQAAVRHGELTAAAARDLVPWIDEPAVLDEVRRKLKDVPVEKRSVALAEILKRAWMDESRPVEGYHYDRDVGRHFNLSKMKLTDEQRTALRIREVSGWGRNKESRAFNVKEWFKIADGLDKANRAKETSKGRTGPTGNAQERTPEEKRENAKKQKEIFEKRLYKFRVSWYQAQAIAWLAECDHATLLAALLFLSTRSGQMERKGIIQGPGIRKATEQDVLPELLGRKEADLFEVARRVTKEQVAGEFCKWTNAVDPADIETLAVHLKVDIQKQWSKSFAKGAPCEHLWDAFCGLFTADQIRDVLSEAGTKTDTGPYAKATRKELQGLLKPEFKCPKAILNAKKVSLC